jgi:acyl-CoA synthetase (AMP-forming)/AMP-acid ligase II
MFDSLVDYLEYNSEQRPDSIAITQGDRLVSYKEVVMSARALAKHLLDRGINQGDRVALLLENSPEYVFAYYAVLMVGGVVVGLNASAKYRELSAWLSHSEANYLIVDANHVEFPLLLESFVGEVIVQNVEDKNFKKPVSFIEDLLSANIVGPEVYIKVNKMQAAAIIYTSGTTGSPKGVTLSHNNLVKNTESIIKYLKLTEYDSVLNLLPFYYSYGNSILHTHLVAGGNVVLQNNMLFPKLILDEIQKRSVSGFSGVASTYALLLNRANMSDYDLSSLRYVTQAGGPMPSANIEKIMEILPKAEFYMMYGQTEATARLSYLPPELIVKKLGSIGIPIPGVQLEIRGSNGEITNPGEVGEIYAKGKNIMLGYWKDKKKTEETIINGWLKTGDLAHYDEDGLIYIDGRSSDMIKTGANRVSPKDIEEVICSINGVVEASAIGVPDEIMGQVIYVYVVLADKCDITKREILAHCKKELATYKIPKSIEFLEELPKTASGKVKKYLLKNIYEGGNEYIN